MSEIQKQIELLKEQRIQEIINDESISKLDRLELLEKENLFGYAPYIQDEFPEWEKEIIELEKIEAERILKEGSPDPNEICARMFYQSKMVDTRWDPSESLYEKHDLVSYSRLLNSLEENDEEDFEEYYDENGNSKDGLITIMTTRHPRVILRKSKQEIIDKLYDFCIANKIIGFKMDW